MWWFPRQTIHRLFDEIHAAKTKQSFQPLRSLVGRKGNEPQKSG